MPYNSSGVFTRVDNSFSNPVLGTVINPTHADTFFDDIDAGMNAYYGTSTSSVEIGTGSKTFTTQADKLFSAGRFVVIRSDANSANYMFGQVTSYSSTTLTVSVSATGGSGTLADWTIYIAGAPGSAGPVAGVRQTYSTTTTDSDPGAGIFRLNNATVASATEGYFDNTEIGGGSITAILDKWDDSTSTVKGALRIEKETDPTVWAEFSVSGSVVDGTGYRKVTLSGGASNGTFTNGDIFRLSFLSNGDAGSSSGDVTAASSFGTDNVLVRSDGTGKGTQATGIVIADTTDAVSDIGTILPKADNTQQLGSTTKNWADLFLGSGAVINYNNGDVTITHSSNSLAFAGGTSYTFDVAPSVSGSSLLSQALNLNLTGGVTATSYNAGTKSSGTFTPDALNGNIQHCVNGGAFTLEPPSSACSIILQIVNDSLAGTITTSGFSKVNGDSFTTTNGKAFECVIRKTNSYSLLTITAIN